MIRRESRRRKHRIGAATLLSMLLISGAFGVTTWRYEHAQSSARSALAEEADHRADGKAADLLWQERELINDYLINHRTTILGQIGGLQLEFDDVLHRRHPGRAEGIVVQHVLAGNRRLLVQFAYRRQLREGQLGPSSRANDALRPFEQAVTNSLDALAGIDLQKEQARSQSAASASAQARIVAVFGGVFALLAGLGFALFASRLLARSIRQSETLQQTLAEREEAYAALRDRDEQLRHAQKMEAVGRLAGGIAHDFNNMLLAITGYAELSLADVDARQPRLRHALEQITIAANRAAGLTGQLLTFSRQQTLRTQVVPINALVEGLTSMLRPLLGETVDLRVHLDDEAGAVKADPGQLEQVITNLAVNARDSMATGGCITITTEAIKQDKAVRSVRLSVEDTGEGMSEETRARAFEPFFTTKETGKGTGLGLATVHGIISQAGGRVEILTQLGQGTTFNVYLPSTDAAEDIPTPEQDPAPGGTETVLLVEDDEQVRLMLSGALRAQGYGVIAAADAAAAIDAFDARDRNSIDMLLTDVVMPGMHGGALSEHLRSTSPKLRTVFMSGYTEDTELNDRAEAGSIDFLQKPFSSADLARTVRRVLDRVAAPA